MGSADFYTFVDGRSPQEAFAEAREKARRDHGHLPYTGTIAEKTVFEIVTLPPEEVERVRGSLFAQARARVAAIEAAPLREALVDLPWLQDEADRARHVAAARQAMDALQGEEELSRRVAEAAARDRMRHDHPPFADKTGPAGCIIIRKADPVVPLSPEEAQRLVHARWGPEATLRLTEGQDLLGARMVTARVERKHARSAHVLVAAWESGATPEEACGRLIARKGAYLFFGRSPT